MSAPRIGFPLMQPQFTGDAWPAGLQYVRNLLAALQTVPVERVPEIVVFRPESARTVLMEGSAPPWYSEFRLPVEGSLRETMRRAVRHTRCTLLFPVMTAPELTPDVPLIGWIADFQHRRLPEFFSRSDYESRETAYGLLAGCAARIVCSSQSVADDFSAAYPLIAAKAALLRFRAAIDLRWVDLDPQETLDRLGVSGPYVYMPNQFWRHKNHELAFAAWRELRQRGETVSLVCSGPTTDYRWPDYFRGLERFLAEHSLQDSIRVLGQVDRIDQIQLYRGASLVLQPSRFEGWSTTLEEARALGKPMAVSDIPVHHEQCGDAAWYFGLEEPTLLSDLIQSLVRRLNPGHDAEAERTALTAASDRLRVYGEEIVALWNHTATATAANAAVSAERSMVLLALGDLTERLQDHSAAVERQAADANSIVSALQTALNASEADRAERLSVIERMGSQLGQIPHLESQLAACNADRAARLEIIERQGIALGRIGTLEADVTFLKQQIEIIEQDRAARLAVIERQAEALDNAGIRIEAIEDTTSVNDLGSGGR